VTPTKLGRAQLLLSLDALLVVNGEETRINYRILSPDVNVWASWDQHLARLVKSLASVWTVLGGVAAVLLWLLGLKLWKKHRGTVADLFKNAIKKNP